MNHLAHLFLAPDSPEARIGSILGDFCKGLSLRELPEQVQRGMQHHWSVDDYTDRHPQVLASRRLFSSRRRRFAGVALDILYDHYLLKHWYEFTGVEQDEFIRRVYRELSEHEPLMPDAMARVTRRMTEDDWFGHYRHLDNIDSPLTGLPRESGSPTGLTASSRKYAITMPSSRRVFSVFPRPGARLKGLLISCCFQPSLNRLMISIRPALARVM